MAADMSTARRRQQDKHSSETGDRNGSHSGNLTGGVLPHPEGSRSKNHFPFHQRRSLTSGSCHSALVVPPKVV